MPFTGMDGDVSEKQFLFGTPIGAGCWQCLYSDSEGVRYHGKRKKDFRQWRNISKAATFSGESMRAERKFWFFSLMALGLLFVLGVMLGVPCRVHAEELSVESEKNEIYDALKERMETSWDRGMEQLEQTEPIEITGNIAERFFRSIAAALYQNLKSIQAGALLIGVVSFVLGGVMVLLARKDKKIQKKAIGICMTAIPGLLTVLVIGIAWFVGLFR